MNDLADFVRGNAAIMLVVSTALGVWYLERIAKNTDTIRQMIARELLRGYPESD